MLMIQSCKIVVKAQESHDNPTNIYSTEIDICREGTTFLAMCTTMCSVFKQILEETK